ncbi:MAG: hypothetical protein MJE68_03305 [Proteobacteria bacterium]|nr:hypothetical protein [Pseudomonadota bacterium]
MGAIPLSVSKNEDKALVLWGRGRFEGREHCIIPIYLWRILEIKRVVESKVHEAHESRIELHESQHYPKVNVSGHLQKN